MDCLLSVLNCPSTLPNERPRKNDVGAAMLPRPQRGGDDLAAHCPVSKRSLRPIPTRSPALRPHTGIQPRLQLNRNVHALSFLMFLHQWDAPQLQHTGTLPAVSPFASLVYLPCGWPYSEPFRPPCKSGPFLASARGGHLCTRLLVHPRGLLGWSQRLMNGFTVQWYLDGQPLPTRCVSHCPVRLLSFSISRTACMRPAADPTVLRLL